jgi:pimeloyl-ACP methyl ester carboxylesterase
MTPTPTMVLVHGAWADASSWNGVTKRLQPEGYTVMAPSNPLRGMTSDSAYIAVSSPACLAQSCSSRIRTAAR